MSLVSCQKKDDAKPISSSPIMCSAGEVMGPGVIGGKLLKPEGRIAQSVVALLSGNDQEELSLCTGTLIAPNVVLTAAHCVMNKENRMLTDGVVLFTNDFMCDVIQKKDKSRARRFEEVIVHPDYDNNHPALGNDLAMIRFEQSAPQGFVIMPLAEKYVELTKDRPVYLAGYGKTTEYEIDDESKPMLRLANVRPSARIERFGIENSKTSSQLAFDQSQGESVCAGDSGGPALVMEGGGLQVIGVASIVYNQKEDRTRACQDIVIHTSISYYQPWIKKTLKSLLGTEARKDTK